MNERENASLFKTAQAWRADGRKVAIATVIKTWGSAPRPAGARLIAADDGAFAGSVSGGCVEGAVMEAAMETMQTEAPKLLRFGVADETAWEVGLSCGGEMEILTEPFAGPRAERMAETAAAVESRQPRILLTRIPDGAQTLLNPDAQDNGDESETESKTKSKTESKTEPFPPCIKREVLDILRGGGEARLSESRRLQLLRRTIPPPAPLNINRRHSHCAGINSVGAHGGV